MENILFRGKSKETGKWVIGFYVEHPKNKKPYIISTESSKCEAVEVIPKTVGQYIGITDIQGNKIFKDDIILHKRVSRPHSIHRKVRFIFSIVKYCTSEVNSKYYAVKWVADPIDKTVSDEFPTIEWGDFYDCIVVGNIHDNPELINKRAEKVETTKEEKKATDPNPDIKAVIIIKKGVLKYGCNGYVAYNLNWLKENFDRERKAILVDDDYCDDAVSRKDVIQLLNKAGKYSLSALISDLPKVIPERSKGMWNNHEVATLLEGLFGDPCACHINNNKSWLPKYCDFAKTVCPNTAGVACWEQFLKYRAMMEYDDDEE